MLLPSGLMHYDPATACIAAETVAGMRRCSAVIRDGTVQKCHSEVFFGPASPPSFDAMHMVKDSGAGLST